MSNPKANAVLVETLGSSLRYGGGALSDVPGLFKDLMRDQAWREFLPRGRSEPIRPKTFAAFVTEPPLDGLGCDLSLFRRVIASDREALDLFEEAVRNPHGGDHTSPESKNNNIQLAPQGTSKARALRKLRKDAPELHAEVLVGRVSPHAAMVKAGFRPKTITVPVTRPEAVAKSLLKHMSADDIAKLIAVLLGKESR